MQTNVIAMHSTTEAQLLTGVVKSLGDPVFVIQTHQGVVTASQAASCLLKPDIDDKVLLSFVDDEIYILAVLVKANNHSKLSFQGDVVLEMPGELAINAAKTLRLSSAVKISQTAPEIGALSAAHTVYADNFKAHCQNMAVHSDRVQAQGQELHGTFDRVFQKSDQVMRWVETIETLNIGNWVQNIKHTLNSRAQHQIITAKSDVRVDAERIHMG